MDGLSGTIFITFGAIYLLAAGALGSALGNGAWPSADASGIQHPFELACDFDQLSFCKWRNVLDDRRGKEAGADWALYERLPAPDSRGTGAIVHAVPRGVTGIGDKFVAVSGASAGIARSARAKRRRSAWLVSDAVPCQSAYGSLAFALWSSGAPSKLRVCIRKPPGDAGRVKCMAKVDAASDTHTWSARQVDVPASKQPFEIVLEARLRHESDVLALDKIVYAADNSCDKRPIGLEPIVPVNAPPVKPVVSRVSKSSGTGSSEPAEHTDSSSDGHDEEYEEREGDGDDDVRITIDWESALRRPDGISDIDWQILQHNFADRLSARSAVSSTTETPPVDTNRRQVLPELLSKEFGLSAPEVDELVANRVLAPEGYDDYDYAGGGYDNDDGEGDYSQALSEVAATAAVECAALTCGFEQSLCDYEAYRLDTKAGVLRFLCHPLVAHRRFRDPPQGLCFLAVRTARDVPVIQILASRPFTLPVDAKVHFRYFLPNSGGGQIAACINSLQNCTWSADKPRRGLELWWRHAVELPAGRNQIFFVLTQWKNGTLVGLDDVTVELMPKSEHGVASVPCVPPDELLLRQHKDDTPLQHNITPSDGTVVGDRARRPPPPPSLQYQGRAFSRAASVTLAPGRRLHFAPLRRWNNFTLQHN